ncbi:caspase-9 isoform X2 [Athene cunicularia]|uniref:caspase-9 isoform X2 n=1 Tax=Athene cunicularia TaxID=194338 RepID=UPI000EF69099|nr:caspase-9 isoform X2 [Athene cunicularia]
MLIEECKCSPVPPQLVDLRPVKLELRGEKQNKNVNFPEHLSIPVQAESERLQKPRMPAQGSAVDKRNHDLVYELKADPCGHCLILNNVNFSEDSDLLTRDGSDVDCEKLEKRFKALRFNVLTRRNLKAQEMVSELRNLARRDHSTLDCCIVVILSHGCQKDRGFVVDHGSPSDEAPGGSLESDATPFQTPSGNVDEPDAIASLPTPSDILVSYSTFPGFVSWREVSSGSWYVETLDSVLEQYAHSEDLLNMWQTLSLPRGGTSRCQAVSIFSVKNSSSRGNDVWALRSLPGTRVTFLGLDEISTCCVSASMLPVAFVCLSRCLS